jgi:hypothetical protein
MTRTKLNTPAFADQSVDSRNIADGAVQAQDISGSITGTQLAGSIANDKLANSSLSINGSSLSLGASTTLGVLVTWQAVTVADGSTTLTAQAGKGYFLDTNTGVIEVFLPTSPSRGDTIILVDYSGTFATNKCIINTGGQLIDSTVGSEVKLTTNNTIAELVYVDSNKGWLVKLNQAAGTTPSNALTGFSSSYDSEEPFISATGGTVTETGDFKVHTFTGDGNFVVSQLGTPNTSTTVDYLVIAGGGAGGGSGPQAITGGGGAGGFRTNFPSPSTGGQPVLAQTYPITVGAGANGVRTPSSTAANGSNSVFSTITSAGGGGGGASPSAGANGGSGGGSFGSGGSGNTPPVSPPQGNNGGSGHDGGPISFLSAGGGGGAGAVGQSPGSPGATSGDGGAGTASSITGSSVTRAGGGGGSVDNGRSAPAAGAGGSGGGGAGGANASGVAGTVNTGGGGGGGCAAAPAGAGGSGGKGVVIIRYKFQ